MKIKVCGLTDADNLDAVAGLNVDRLGLIFYPGSGRFAGNNLMLQKHCKLSPPPGLTGVFVNEQEATIQEAIVAYGLSYIQLHGSESPACCARINAVRPVVKAFAVSKDFDFGMLKKYRRSCSAFLFDTPHVAHGGSGRSFDWALLQDKDVPLPFWLAGGIGPGDAAKIKTFQHPAWTGIDLNSRFEIKAGVKDTSLLRTFINDIHK